MQVNRPQLFREVFSRSRGFFTMLILMQIWRR